MVCLDEALPATTASTVMSKEEDVVMVVPERKESLIRLDRLRLCSTCVPPQPLPHDQDASIDSLKGKVCVAWHDALPQRLHATLLSDMTNQDGNAGVDGMQKDL